MLLERVVSLDEMALNGASSPAAGPPLLLLHGVGRRWQDFAPILPALTQRWQTHALDFRGHGGSGRCPGRYRVCDYAADVVRMVRTQWTGPAVLYGHSLGALVAAWVAAEVPRGVRAVILEDPPGADWLARLGQTSYSALFAGFRALAGRDRSVSETARLLADLPVGPADDPAALRLGDRRDATSLRFTAHCLRDVDPEVFTPLLENRWLEGYAVPEVMRGIRCPALLLCADERAGGMLPAHEAAALAGLIADCTRIDLPGVGHLVHWTETEQTMRLVLGFLESL